MNIRFYLIFLILSIFPLRLDAQVVIADAIKLTHTDGPPSGEAIVDESEPGFSYSGYWVVGTGAGGYLDTYLYSVASDSDRKAGYWAVNVPISGTYDVTAWYIPGTNRLTNVLYRILHSGGVSEVVIDQSSGGNWSSIGSFDFSARGYIQISNRLAVNGAEDIIIDNGETLFSTTDYWPLGGVPEVGFRGDYTYHICSVVPSATAQWDVPVFVGGNYDVYAWVVPGSNRNSAAHYTIPYSGGVREKTIDQSKGEEGWRYLGVFPFTPGNYHVELGNAGPTDKVVIADGLIFQYSSTQGPLPPYLELSPEVLMPSSGEDVWVKAEAWSVSPGLVVKGERWIDVEPHQWVDFYDDGLHQDGASGDGIFGGALPGAPAETVIKYRIYATNDTTLTSETDERRCLVAYDNPTSPELRIIFGGPYYTPAWADSTLEHIRSGNLNAQVVKVTSDVYCYYQSSYQPMFPTVPPGYDPLAGLIERSHDTSGGKSYIQVHAFIVFFVALTTDTPPPGHVLDLHPEWTSENYDGEQVIVASNTRMYLDAGVPEVQDYYVDMVMEIVNNYDIDGFNLDHIRYREQNMGYNPIALSWFHHFTGRSDRPAIDDPEWSAWRREQITNLVKRFYANILKVKPNVLVTMDGVTGTGPEEVIEDNLFWWGVFQDYPGWISNHHMDAVMGMAYREEADPVTAQNFVDWNSFLRSIKGDREAAAIVAANKNRIQDTLVQLHKVRKSGSSVLCIYNYSDISNEYEPEETFYEALRSQLFPTSVFPPDYSWRSNPTTGVVMGRIFVEGNPSRRSKVTLGARETITDLCGFYVLFDVSPGNHELTLYDNDDEILYNKQVYISAGAVLEINFPDVLRVPKNLWMSY